MQIQINAYNTDAVYVKPHIRGGKYIAPYVCSKKNLNSKNENIEQTITDSLFFR